jgi:hypothetical protein
MAASEVAFSDLGSLRQRESVVDIYAKIPHGVLDLAEAEQDLDGSQVPCGLVDERRCGTAQRMDAIFLRRRTIAVTHSSASLAYWRGT